VLQFPAMSPAKKINWSSPPQSARKRKKVQFTLSDAARARLEELAADRGPGQQSRIVEELILGLAKHFYSGGTLADMMADALEAGLTDDERREQVAVFAFANLALTEEWSARPLSELEELKRACERFVQISPRGRA